MNNQPTRQYRVAMLGAGQMGSALARAVRAGGIEVTVWNRTPERARQLVADGITAASTVLEAVAGSDLILVCVLDPASATALLCNQEVEAALEGKTVVNYTTGTPSDANAMAEWAKAKGIEYVDGVVMCLPTEVAKPHALLVHAGSRQGFDRHETALRLLGGQSIFADEAAGSAAVIDSALLTFYYGSIMSVCQAGLLADAHGMSLPKLIPMIERFVPTMLNMVGLARQMVASGQFLGKDANLSLHYNNGLMTPFNLAKAAGVRTDLYEALEKMMGYAIAQGRGDEELPAVFDALKKSTSVG